MKNEYNANLAIAKRASDTNGWVVGKNFAVRKTAKQQNVFIRFMRKHGIISFRQSAKTV